MSCRVTMQHWVRTVSAVCLSHTHNTAGDSLLRRIHNSNKPQNINIRVSPCHHKLSRHLCQCLLWAPLFHLKIVSERNIIWKMGCCDFGGRVDRQPEGWRFDPCFPHSMCWSVLEQDTEPHNAFGDCAGSVWLMYNRQVMLIDALYAKWGYVCNWSLNKGLWKVEDRMVCLLLLPHGMVYCRTSQPLLMQHYI